MRESGWYPPGAEFDPNAPYNQVEPEEREYSIEAVFELHRTDELWSSYYDEFGNLRDPQGDWTSVHYTPLELIAECKQLARTMLDSIDDTATPMGVRARQHLLRVIAECDGWENTFNEFNQE
jgi:hypothetical protein